VPWLTTADVGCLGAVTGAVGYRPMSADSRTVCPVCHPDVLDYTGPNQFPLVHPGVIDHCAEERGYDRSVRENIDYYLQNKDQKLVLVFDYRADCWDCGWHYDTVLQELIPGLETP